MKVEESQTLKETELASKVALVTNTLMMIIADLENASRLYDKLFDSISRINYSATVYKQLDRLVSRTCSELIKTILVVKPFSLTKITQIGDYAAPEIWY